MATESTPPPLKTPSAAKPYHAGSGSAPERGNGRGWILALGILQTAGGMIMYALMPRSEGPFAEVALAIMMGLAGIYFGLWIWGKKSPFPALLTTLIVFVTFLLVDAVFDPAQLFRGIIVKGVVVTGLCVAVKKAYVAKREQELASQP